MEVHDEGEVDRAVEAGARIIGINNRDAKWHDIYSLDLALARQHAVQLAVGRMEQHAVRADEVALRRDEASRPEHSRATLWTEVHDPRFTPDVVAALAAPVDLPRVLDRALDAIIDAYLPA